MLCSGTRRACYGCVNARYCVQLCFGDLPQMLFALHTSTSAHVQSTALKMVGLQKFPMRVD